jgi:hypothetical protein
MSARPSSTSRSAKGARSDRAVSYHEFKEYEGQKYTGMAVGRSHKWYYDKGEWKETKITPDLWQVAYAVSKRRAGRAPEGSGVPVGTEYHWYVLAHQNVAKQTANDYTTSLTGLKFKIAHKRAGAEKWSATPRTQRKRMITFLRSVLADLEKQTDHDRVLTAQQTTPRKRTARVPRASAKRAAARQHRASRESKRRAARYVTSSRSGRRRERPGTR